MEFGEVKEGKVVQGVKKLQMDDFSIVNKKEKVMKSNEIISDEKVMTLNLGLRIPESQRSFI